MSIAYIPILFYGKLIKEKAMKVEISNFGKAKDGSDVKCYTLSNERGMTVSLLNLGAIVKDILVPDKDGKLVDVNLGYDSVEGYYDNLEALGSFVGRNANRIGGARVSIDGVTYELEKNDGENNLHSGSDRSHYMMFDAEVFEDEYAIRVRFMRTFKDMEQGFPGKAELSVTYTLTEDNELILEYRGVSDKDTVINPTNHSYFNLDGEGDILSHKLYVNADRFTAIGEDMIPTGELVDVSGTPMDLRVAKMVGEGVDSDYHYIKLAKGYDHNYVLNNTFGEIEKVAEFSSDKSGISMEVLTDLPGMQIYTANFLENKKGKGGAVYGRRSGCCFETQYFPNACNEKNFVSSILRAGEEYKSTTVFKFMA